MGFIKMFITVNKRTPTGRRRRLARLRVLSFSRASFSQKRLKSENKGDFNGEAVDKIQPASHCCDFRAKGFRLLIYIERFNLVNLINPLCLKNH